MDQVRFRNIDDNGAEIDGGDGWEWFPWDDDDEVERGVAVGREDVVGTIAMQKNPIWEPGMTVYPSKSDPNAKT